jgi:hypothetical protein
MSSHIMCKCKYSSKFASSLIAKCVFCILISHQVLACICCIAVMDNDVMNINKPYFEPVVDGEKDNCMIASDVQMINCEEDDQNDKVITRAGLILL